MAFYLIFTATLYLTALALHRITDPLVSSPPSRYHEVYIDCRPNVTTCLCTSALLVVELGSCRLH